jgi:hypothetical protein
MRHFCARDRIEGRQSPAGANDSELAIEAQNAALHMQPALENDKIRLKTPLSPQSKAIEPLAVLSLGFGAA